MEETFPTTCIILKRNDFREVDSRIVAYSDDHGLLDLVARGTKKLSSRLAPHLEPFSRSKIMVIKGRQFDYVGGAVSENCFVNIKESAEKLEASGLAIRYFLQIVKGGISDSELYGMLEEYLNFLNRKNTAGSNFWAHIFLLKILSHLGYRPELYRCLDDGKEIKPGNNCFSAQKGGLVCGHCPSDPGHTKISDDCIKILRIIISENIYNISKIKINKKLETETVKLIESFYNFHIGR